MKIGVSACLLGHPVRYDGGHKREPAVVDVLAKWAELIPVCPEVEGGLGTPREPMAFVKKNGRCRLEGLQSGRDLTDVMVRFAERRCAELDVLGLAGFVFKARSPSCGLRNVPGAGRGIFADAFVRRYPGLPVVEEGDLREPGSVKAFLKETAKR